MECRLMKERIKRAAVAYYESEATIKTYEAARDTLKKEVWQYEQVGAILTFKYKKWPAELTLTAFKTCIEDANNVWQFGENEELARTPLTIRIKFLFDYHEKNLHFLIDAISYYSLKKKQLRRGQFPSLEFNVSNPRHRNIFQSELEKLRKGS